jgi:hypothetical protein
MLAALLAIALASPPVSPGPRYTTRECMRSVRNSRGLTCGANLAFFEFAPASGAGMGTMCACTTPTGAKGETLTFTRASSGTCLKSTNATSIANGDLVTCATNQPRVMPGFDPSGVLGLLVESSRTNVALQSGDLSNAAYTSVGAPTVTGNTTVAPDGTTTMTTIQDNSGAAQEGRAQTVTVTAASTNTLSLFVKAGTLSSVTLSLDGTLQTCPGLSSTVATLCSVTDASASGVSISAQVLGGTVVGDTGTFVAWGMQVETTPYTTSYIATTAAAVTRAVDDPTIALTSTTVTAPFSLAGTVVTPSAAVPNARLHGTLGPAGLATYVADSFQAGSSWSADSTQVTPNTFSTGQLVSTSSVVRAATYHDGTNFAGCINGACTTSARAWTSLASVTTYKPGMYSTVNGVVNGVVKQICFDPDPARCQ